MSHSALITQLGERVYSAAELAPPDDEGMMPESVEQRVWELAWGAAQQLNPADVLGLVISEPAVRLHRIEGVPYDDPTILGVARDAITDTVTRYVRERWEESWVKPQGQSSPGSTSS